jgi:hypothetical protein
MKPANDPATKTRSDSPIPKNKKMTIELGFIAPKIR